MIGSGITIKSGVSNMVVGDAALGLVNNGTLQADGMTLTVAGANWSNSATGVLKANGGTLTAGNSWSNAGSLSAIGGALNLGGTWSNTNTAPITVAGGTLSLGGTWSNAAPFSLTAGVLNIGGTWSGNPTINESGGTLSLNSAFTTAQLANITRTAGSVQLSGGAWNNSDASYDLSAAGHLGTVTMYNGSAITGGTISASGSDYLSLAADHSATLTGVTLNAAMTQGKNTTLNISNGLTLNNTLTMSRWYYQDTVLSFNGTGAQTLGGTGTIVTSDAYNAGYTGNSAYIRPTTGASLVIGSGITIKSGVSNMVVGAAALGLVNHGTLQAEHGPRR